MQQLDQLVIISKSDVIENFSSLINDYCEQYHVIHELPRRMVCSKMVNLFKGTIEHNADWIRKQIDNRYKLQHRVKNGEKRKDSLRNKKEKESSNDSKLSFTDIIHQTIDVARKEF